MWTHLILLGLISGAGRRIRTYPLFGVPQPYPQEQAQTYPATDEQTYPLNEV